MGGCGLRRGLLHDYLFDMKDHPPHGPSPILFSYHLPLVPFSTSTCTNPPTASCY